MNITLRQVKNGKEVFDKIMKHPMDFKLAYRVSKISGQLSSEHIHIEKSRIEIVKKYGVLGDNKQYTFTDENNLLANNEFNELLNVSITSEIQPIPFECMNGLILTPLEVSLIEPFVEEPK